MMSNQPQNILVVDDEARICQMIKEELAEYGHQCNTVTAADEAEQLLTRKAFDLVIADICMPDTSGLELLARIRERDITCPVILITGVSTRERLTQALMLGAYDYVEKPFFMGELAELVQQALSETKGTSHLSLRAAEALEKNTDAKEAALESVQALVRSVEAKDPYTRRHSEHVARYAVRLGQLLDMASAQLESIRIASLLHDVGKIGIPDKVLTKADALTDAEFEQVKHHPILGEEILSKVRLLAEEARLVRHHHERWDGGGYPDGLAGEDIPLGSRIIHVADAMDAMLMERTYKGCIPPEKMLNELVRCSGTQFDPHVVHFASEWWTAHPENLILPGRTTESPVEV